MPRSLKKGPYIEERLIKRIAGLKKDDKAIVKVWKRAVAISPEMVGFTFGVHNGKEFIPVYVTEDMVGHKLGEFSPTTKFSRHGGKMQKDQETKAKASETATAVATKTKKK
ncbi:MAG: 30S ribosomal protein S19 [Candidatus Gribaldobacteria bacterium]|nr:30S ribosomal protein S19 [Candidatus Gribaldobacteria bacterium]